MTRAYVLIMSKPYFFYITGSNGFIGRHIVRCIEQSGFQWSRLYNDRGQVWRFGESPQDTVDSQYENILIHCAWDMKADSESANQLMMVSSQRLFEFARQKEMAVCFISSMSSFQGCQSLYGKTKFILENDLCQSGLRHIIIRPGLVWENQRALSGIIGTLEKIINLLPLVPYLNHGHGRFYFTEVNELAQKVVMILTDRLDWDNQYPVLAHKKSYTLKEILLEIANKNKKTVLLFPFPVCFLKFIIKLLNLIGLKIIRNDSLISLLNLDERPMFSNISGQLTSFSISEGIHKMS